MAKTLPIEDTDLMSVQEITDKFKISQKLVYSWVKQGKLLYAKNDAGLFKFPREQVEKIWEERYEKNYVNRRQEARIPALFPVSLSIKFDGREPAIFESVTTDISASGMRLVVMDCHRLKNELTKGKTFDARIHGLNGPLFNSNLEGKLMRFEYVDTDSVAVGLKLASA